jgi:hypothetical protein
MTPVLSHLVGCRPVWFCMQTWFPTTRGGSFFVCSDHRSAAFMRRFHKASSLAASVSLQVGCGLYRPGRMGIWRRRTGDSFVSVSGELRYWRIAS